MADAEIQHGSEAVRHMNRSGMGVAIGVVVAVLVIGVENIPILLLGVILGAVGGSFIGAAFDIRGAACDILGGLHAKLDPYVKTKPGDKKEDEDNASES